MIWRSALVVVAIVIVGTTCGDARVCEAADNSCGPNPPPGPGDPAGPPWDTDGDSISNNTELHPPNEIYGFRVDTVDMNPSRALGQPANGTLDSGINLPDDGTMYVHHLGSDAPQTDDWGILRLINVIEEAGRLFDINGPCRFHSTWTALPRMQVGDLSLQGGGFWSDHDSHQTGQDVDVRYLRDDSGEAPLDLTVPADSARYSVLRTLDLIDCFLGDPGVELILYDRALTGIDSVSGRLIDWPGHHNHFHVRVKARP